MGDHVRAAGVGDSEATPKFVLNGLRYPQDTFAGRFRHFVDLSDPRCLAPKFFFGLSLEESKQLLDKCKDSIHPMGVSNEQLWLAQKIRVSAIHPDTNEEILPPFRMSGYAVFG